MKSNFGARRVLVNAAFSDEAIWREALGEREPLHVASTTGPLDAPDNMPAGAMRSGKRETWPMVMVREGSILW